MGEKQKLKQRKPDQGPRISIDPSKATNPDRLPPKFCLKLRTGYSLYECEKNEKAAFADRLQELSIQTWAQLRQAPRSGQGFEKIARTAITGDGVPQELSDDVNIIAFRFCGRMAMVGYRTDDGVFHILWLDREFKLYKHE